MSTSVLTASPSNDLNLNLHYKQGIVFLSKATEILFGGAAGPGKSHGLRVFAIAWCLQIPGLQVYLFRRLFPDLMNGHMMGPTGFPSMLATLMLCKLVSIDWSNHLIKFFNGSVIHLCHCQYEKDVWKYLSAEFHVLMIDELTQFTAPMYKALRARVRLGGLDVPAKFRGLFPRIVCASNPGGIGHNFVKAMFIDIAPPLRICEMPPAEGGMMRQFIPARLEDNPTLTQNDPDYENRLEGLGDKTLVRAMRWGDWNIVAGGLLDDVWDDAILICAPFALPTSWGLDRSFDWGSTKPYACGWWAESDGTAYRDETGKERHMPRGSLIMFSELYGYGGEPNVGTREGADSVALKIMDREAELTKSQLIRRRVLPGPADASIFDEDGRESIAMMQAKKSIRWLKADKSPGSRINGLEALRKRLKATTDQNSEEPHLYFFNSCLHAKRTLPVLPRDPNKPDDCDTKAEDHIYDMVRYRIYNPPRRGGQVIIAGVY